MSKTIEFGGVQTSGAADPNIAAALDALSELVAAADRLSYLWGDLDDPTCLEQGYPQVLPSFDEFAELLGHWRDKARAAASQP
jgi:hypothetical protein